MTKALLLIATAWFIVIGCNPKSPANAPGTSDSTATNIGTGAKKTIKTRLLCLLDKEIVDKAFRPDSLKISFGDNSDAVTFGNRILALSFANGNIKFNHSNDVDNAEADIIDGVRYVLYNNTFMNFADAQTHHTKDEWASISILAHEVGHHILGHAISSKSNEIEADKQSGWYMCGLGATQEEAIVAVGTLMSDDGDPTHPGRKDRIKAVIEGFKMGIVEFAARKKFSDKNVFTKCLDSLNSDACEECARQCRVVCESQIHAGKIIEGTSSSDTCEKVDLFNMLSSAIGRKNSFKDHDQLTSALNEQKKANTIIQELKGIPTHANKLPVPSNCIVKKNGKDWNQCIAKQYEGLAYDNLLSSNPDLVTVKSYLATSYAAFPWLGTVDEVYNRVLIPSVMQRYATSSTEGQKLIIKEVLSRIAQEDYVVGVPLARRLEVLSYKAKEVKPGPAL